MMNSARFALLLGLILLGASAIGFFTATEAGAELAGQHVDLAATSTLRPSPQADVPPSMPTPAATSTLPAMPATLPTVPGTHVVRPSETLFCLGRAYGVRPRAIAEFNGLDPDAKLLTGQMLVIPDTLWLRPLPGRICTPQLKSSYSLTGSDQESESQKNNSRLSSVVANPTPFLTAETRIVVVDWPERMPLGASREVVLTFNPETSQPEVSVTVIPGQPREPSQSQPLSIPDVFGSYLVFATARLDAVGFRVSPSTDIKYPVRLGEGITWRWSIKPLEAEKQMLIISLQLNFEPKDPDSTPPLSEMPLWSRSFTANVGETIFGLTVTQLNTFGTVSLVAGSILSVYGVWEKFGLALSKKKSEQAESKTPIKRA